MAAFKPAQDRFMQAPHSFAARNADIGWQLLEASNDGDTRKFTVAADGLRTLIEQVSMFCANLGSPLTSEEPTAYARSVRRLMVLDETKDLGKLKNRVTSEADCLSASLTLATGSGGVQANETLKALKLDVASFSQTLAEFNL